MVNRRPISCIINDESFPRKEFIYMAATLEILRAISSKARAPKFLTKSDQFYPCCGVWTRTGIFRL